MACDSSRFDTIIEKKIPLVLSVGALDMVNFGARDTIPSDFQHRKIYEHTKQVKRALFFNLCFCPACFPSITHSLSRFFQKVCCKSN